jgi:hypothetical protein
MFNAQQGGDLGLDIMAYMEKHGLDPYGPTPHPRMVDLGLGQEEMLRGIKHEAEAIRKQSEALFALEESQGAPHAMTTTAPASQQELEPSKSRVWTVDPKDVVRSREVATGSSTAPDVVPLSFEDGVWARRAKHATHGIEPVAK